MTAIDPTQDVPEYETFSWLETHLKFVAGLAGAILGTLGLFDVNPRIISAVGLFFGAFGVWQVPNR